MKQILLILAVVMGQSVLATDKKPLTKEESAKVIEAAIRKAAKKPVVVPRPEWKFSPVKPAPQRPVAVKEPTRNSKDPLTEAGKARKKLYDLRTKNKEIGAKLIKTRDLLLSMPQDSPPTREIVRRLAILNKQATNLVLELFAAELAMEKAINEARKINPGPPAKPVKPFPAGTILVSESEVRIMAKGFLIFKRIDDVKLNELHTQIIGAASAEERGKLAGELSDLIWDNAIPYTGKLVEFWDKKRFYKKREEPVLNGERHGIATWWHANGQKHLEGKYVRGFPQGRRIWCREDGTMEYMGLWENDKLLRATTWDATNQKTGEVTVGNGTLVYFHPNGEKRLEETFANGDLIDTKWWDDEGNEVESASPSFIPAPPRRDRR